MSYPNSIMNTLSTIKKRSSIMVLMGLLSMTSAGALEVRYNSLDMSFVFIPPGKFQMGTSPYNARRIAQEMDEPDPDKFLDEAPVHQVDIRSGFWLQRTEVTQAQWFKLMENKPGPSEYWQNEGWENLPVVSVSWDMARRYIEELNKIDEEYRYRLPTEAEWEYAARAGSDSIRPYPASELTGHAWFIENSGDVPHPVGSRKPNAFGVYDMLGNVWEWVNDWYAPATYIKGARINPAGPPQGRSRVRRGGSYHCPLYQTRPGYRAANPPDTAFSVIGFRIIAVEK